MDMRHLWERVVMKTACYASSLPRHGIKPDFTDHWYAQLRRVPLGRTAQRTLCHGGVGVQGAWVLRVQEVRRPRAQEVKEFTSWYFKFILSVYEAIFIRVQFLKVYAHIFVMQGILQVDREQKPTF
jgi:hypothetical protein